MDDTTKILLEYRSASGTAKEDFAAILMARCRVSVLASIRQLAYAYGVKQSEMDDVESDFWGEVFLRALERFDATKGASFTTYLMMRGRSRLIDFLRARKPNATVSLEGLADDLSGDTDRLAEIANVSISPLEDKVLAETLTAFQFRCGSEASSTQEQTAYADLILKLKASAEEDDDSATVLTAFDKSLYLRLMARVERVEHPPSIAPQEPANAIIGLESPRLVALTTALQRAHHWKRWDSIAVGKVSS